METNYGCEKKIEQNNFKAYTIMRSCEGNLRIYKGQRTFDEKL